MKMNKRVTKKRIVITCVVIAITLSFILNMPFFSCSLKHTFYSVMNLPTNRKRARLLIKTDYHALLEACREVMKREDLVPGVRYEPSRLGLPKVIRELGPSAISKRDNYLNIYIRGFMDRFGVYAYPQDFEAPYKGFKYDGIELIPGLWFYAEGLVPKPGSDYVDPNSEYVKWIEKFIQKGKMK
ncbi:MAG: hypothetical protein ACYS17_08380 [Planctomycetota bacterium]|jgi:hypothetical protein